MARVFNFSAGPAMIPEPVLAKAAAEMVEHHDHGMGVMEMSHRSKMYEEIIFGAEAKLRSLMNIPQTHKILFLQGGASLQFAMIPMNLMTRTGKADFVNTGMWSKKAIQEAKKYGTVNVLASSEDKNNTYIPTLDPAKFDKDASYLHITTNNTIFGTRYRELPDVGDVPLVADMSSNILSEVYDASKFGIMYAGAQKNIGPAGLTVVIIREDLMGKTLPGTPTMLDYTVHYDKDAPFNNAMYNTPPTYSIYIAKLVFEWLEAQGGVPAMQKINEYKAGLLYDFLDNSKMFNGPVQKEYRSLMNVPFVANSEELNEKFIKESSKAGFVNLKGHRSVGGMRASIYNAMPTEGVQALVNFMKKFELDNK